VRVAVLVPVPVFVLDGEVDRAVADPDAPEVMETQAAPLDAVHEQPVCAVTEIEPVPEPAPKVWLVGLIEYAQGTPV